MNVQTLLNLVVMSLAAAGGAAITALCAHALGFSGVGIAIPASISSAWAGLFALRQLERGGHQQIAEPAAAE